MTSLAKPLRGEFTLERRENRRKGKLTEQSIMQSAKRRDAYRCRIVPCEFDKQGLVLHVAHERHRGMGGNTKGDRTTRQTLITLCARHHQLYDLGLLKIRALTAHGFDGPIKVGE